VHPPGLRGKAELARRGQVARLDLQGVAAEPSTTYLDLPAGRTGRIDQVVGDQDDSRYYFSEGMAWFSLSWM
jgi:hypothetical protein